MVSASSALATVAVAAGMLQMCPAPPAIVAAVVGGATAGSIGAAGALCNKYCPDKVKRMADIFARDLPPGVSQESIDQCTAQLNDQYNKGGQVTISDVDEDSVLVQSVPPACMNLATVLTSNPAQAGGPVPVPMSSNSLQYNGLSGEDRRNLANTLGA